MRVFTTTPTEDPRTARDVYPRLEAIGYDGAFSFEAKHDPFVPLAAAAQHTRALRLGTAIAIAFARNPMNLAYLGNDLQLLTEGRFMLGLGSQIRPHIVNRFGAEWSEPARRMREMVLAIGAIWRSWATGDPLALRGRLLASHADDPCVRSRAEPVRAATGVRGRLRTADGGDRGGGRRRSHRAPVQHAAARSAS